MSQESVGSHQQQLGGFAALSAAVSDLLTNPVLLDSMDPWGHLDWSLSLPSGEEPVAAPTIIVEALGRAESFRDSELQAHRAERIRHWTERKRVLDSSWREDFCTLPPHCQRVLGPNKNLHLLAEMVQSVDWPDDGLVHDLAFGFPLLGALPRAGILPAVPYAATVHNAESLLANCAQYNAATLERASRPVHVQREVCEAFDKKCLQEVADSKAWWTKLEPDKSIISARFPALEGWRDCGSGFLVPKIRLIDDFSASLVNSATSLGERMPVDTLDTLVQVARALAGDSPGECELLFRKEDFRGAFKSLPLRADHLPFAVVTWQSAAAQGKGLQLICCPFGSCASVYSWHRLGSFFQALLARELLVSYPRFVDDLFSADRVRPGRDAHAEAENAAKSAQELIQLTGWELEPAKRVRCATEATMLGVEVFSCPGELVFEIGATKREKWLETIRAALRSDSLRPSEAKRLAGRLNWAGSAVFGRGSRAYLAALHWQANRRVASLTARVRAALCWWERFLQEIPQRRVPLAPQTTQRCIVYTDAAGDGAMAFAVVHPKFRLWSAAWVPQEAWAWAHPRRTQIVLWELVAAVCAVRILIERGLENCEVVLFVDCNPALHALVRGASRQSDLNAVITEFWFLVAKSGVALHAFRVPSKLNVADGPTRWDTWDATVAEFNARSFHQIQWAWPAALPWSGA